MTNEINISAVVDTNLTLDIRHEVEKFLLNENMETIKNQMIADMTLITKLREQLNERAEENTEKLQDALLTTERLRNQHRDVQSQFYAYKNTVENQIKLWAEEGGSVSADEVIEFGENELDMEFTKIVEVTFSVEVTCSIKVPLATDYHDVSIDDFDISVEYSGEGEVESDTDWECTEFRSNNQ